MDPVTTRGQILRRGLMKRCPVCGSGGLFEHWTKMRERCPGCGHRFERRSEDGFFLGALVINFVVAESVLGVVAAVYIAALAGGGRTSIWPYLGTAAGLAVVMPVITYPFSKTFWAAIDLIMHPLEPSEEAEAILYEHR
jgi:uncharacterized protein (DUF983 family)